MAAAFARNPPGGEPSQHPQHNGVEMTNLNGLRFPVIPTARLSAIHADESSLQLVTRILTNPAAFELPEIVRVVNYLRGESIAATCGPEIAKRDRSFVNSTGAAKFDAVICYDAKTPNGLQSVYKLTVWHLLADPKVLIGAEVKYLCEKLSGPTTTLSADLLADTKVLPEVTGINRAGPLQAYIIEEGQEIKIPYSLLRDHIAHISPMGPVVSWNSTRDARVGVGFQRAAIALALPGTVLVQEKPLNTLFQFPIFNAIKGEPLIVRLTGGEDGSPRGKVEIHLDSRNPFAHADITIKHGAGEPVSIIMALKDAAKLYP